MTGIGPLDLAILTVAAWAFLGLARIIHHRLDRRQVIRQAEQVARDAAQSQP